MFPGASPSRGPPFSPVPPPPPPPPPLLPTPQTAPPLGGLCVFGPPHALCLPAMPPCREGFKSKLNLILIHLIEEPDLEAEAVFDLVEGTGAKRLGLLKLLRCYREKEGGFASIPYPTLFPLCMVFLFFFFENRLRIKRDVRGESVDTHVREHTALDIHVHACTYTAICACTHIVLSQFFFSHMLWGATM